MKSSINSTTGAVVAKQPEPIIKKSEEISRVESRHNVSKVK